jgi:hypothetical protein
VLATTDSSKANDRRTGTAPAYTPRAGSLRKIDRRKNDRRAAGRRNFWPSDASTI